jgi:Na+/melibiose symporter-like transporter
MDDIAEGQSLKTTELVGAPILPKTSRSIWICLGYGAGQYNTQIFFQLAASILLPFMTNILAIPVALAGTVIFIPKLLGVITDTAFGMILDRVSIRLRPWRPYLIGGGLIVAISQFLVFSPPSSHVGVAAAYYIMPAFILANIALSAFSVSYLALGADVASDPYQRTVIMSWRNSFNSIASFSGLLAPLVIAYFGSNRLAYSRMSLIFATISLTAVLATYLCALNFRKTQYRQTRTTVREMLTLLVRPSFYRKMLNIYSVQYFADGVQAGAFTYYILYVVHGKLAIISTVSLCLTIPFLCLQPLWVYLARRFGKIPTYAFAVTGMSVDALTWGIAGNGEVAIACASAAGFGAFFGGFRLLVWSLFLDAVEIDAKETGFSRSGAMSGIWSGIEKASFALGVFSISQLFQVLGLRSSTELYIDQPETAVWAIRIGVSVIPALGFGISAIMIWRMLMRGTSVKPVNTVGVSA